MTTTQKRLPVLLLSREELWGLAVEGVLPKIPGATVRELDALPEACQEYVRASVRRVWLARQWAFLHSESGVWVPRAEVLAFFAPLRLGKQAYFYGVRTGAETALRFFLRGDERGWLAVTPAAAPGVWQCFHPPYPQWMIRLIRQQWPTPQEEIPEAGHEDAASIELDEDQWHRWIAALPEMDLSRAVETLRSWQVDLIAARRLVATYRAFQGYHVLARRNIGQSWERLLFLCGGSYIWQITLITTSPRHWRLQPVMMAQALQRIQNFLA